MWIVTKIGGSEKRTEMPCAGGEADAFACAAWLAEAARRDERFETYEVYEQGKPDNVEYSDIEVKSHAYLKSEQRNKRARS